MDAKDGIFDFSSIISESVLEESDRLKLVNDDSDKIVCEDVVKNVCITPKYKSQHSLKN